MSNPLEQFVQEQKWAALERINGWEFVSLEGDRLTVQFPARDGQAYQVLFICDGYPVIAPSVRFVDKDGSTMNNAAWPTGDNEFLGWIKPPPNCFICMPLIREGLEHHPAWKSDKAQEPWDGSTHTLMDIFNFLSRLLQSEHYQRRAG